MKPNPTYRDRVDAAGAKKLLALDGGGIRGVLTLEVLARIEAMLRVQRDDHDLVLADYFDYIAGTSTGAVIAAGLACGLPVSTLQDLYAQRGREMFDRAFILKRYRYKYDGKRLRKLLQEVVGAGTTFGDDRVQTLLMIVLRNASTDSPWPLSNNPRAMYNDPNYPANNAHMPLWQLVRASTAAPVFFPPEVVSVGEHDFVFVDGGLTMYNNPAFQLFLMATHERFRLGWPASPEQMLLVSVGTGAGAKQDDHLRPNDMNLLYNAQSVPAALMYAASVEQDALCRIFGDCRFGAHLDRELGDLHGPSGITDRKLFSYVRYNADLTRTGLDQRDLPDISPDQVQRMDSVDHIADLQRVGRSVAADVDLEHFAGFLGDIDQVAGPTSAGSDQE